MKKSTKWWLIFLTTILAMFIPFFIIVLIIFVIYKIYEALYFKSKKFLTIKESIKIYANECNELNLHIETLKKSNFNINRIDYGIASYTDNSIFKFKRPKLNQISQKHNIYQCSLSVCKNAQQQPFKYFCKYFNIKPTEETLEQFEKVFNDFSAAEQGKKLLKNKKDEIIIGLGSDIPFLIKKFSYEKLAKKLGFNDIYLDDVYFPKYTFSYVSAGGNSSMKCDIVFDLDNLERFINYLSNIIKFKKSIAGQRALMTSQLREKIKSRDNYTCQICGISTADEPHLLLEIDHIIPLSKNGLTTEANLQTLCWKCNRTKGVK